MPVNAEDNDEEPEEDVLADEDDDDDEDVVPLRFIIPSRLSMTRFSTEQTWRYTFHSITWQRRIRKVFNSQTFIFMPRGFVLQSAKTPNFMG